MPKRILICGDIHDKPPIISRVVSHLKNYDRIIFLGDYVDDWGSSPDISYQVLSRLIRLKKTYPDKITPLMGNHDLSNAFAGRFKCSGFNSNRHALIKELYYTKLGGEYIFQIAATESNFLFTHAGVTNRYCQDLKILLAQHYPDLYELILNPTNQTLSTILNTALIRGFTNPEDKLFLTLAQAGPARGGLQTPSPLWADKGELLQDFCPHFEQIVGHTPVNTTIRTNRAGLRLAFADTHSFSYYPALGTALPIGDGSFLQLYIGKKTILTRKFLS